MSSGSNGAKRVFASIRPSTSSSNNHICLSCRKTILQRTYASAATASASYEPVPDSPHATISQPSTSSPRQPLYQINAGVLLSRAPILTPDPHPFETAYHLYQRRLNERLVLPFSQYFYYKRGTPAFERWRTKRRERGGVAARDVGRYNAYAEDAWNDETLVGNADGSPARIVQALIEEEGRSTEIAGEGAGGETMAGLTRRTKADERGDERDLERGLSRTLYLLVKRRKARGEEGEYWGFPSAPVEGREGLKEAAQRILAASCGVNMNTWFVGNHPVGHLIYKLEEAPSKDTNRTTPLQPPTSEDMPSPVAEKTFFMKSRIMAGQADLTNNDMGTEDFKWLSKEEIRKQVHPSYWSSVRNMLVEQ